MAMIEGEQDGLRRRLMRGRATENGQFCDWFAIASLQSVEKFLTFTWVGFFGCNSFTFFDYYFNHIRFV